MGDYKATRRNYTIALVAFVVTYLGANFLIEFMPERWETVRNAGGDTFLVFATSLWFLYNSYMLRLEWHALSPKDRKIRLWRNDYLALQVLGSILIIIAFAWIPFRGLDGSSSPWTALGARAWGCGLMLGFLLFKEFCRLIERTKLLVAHGWIIIFLVLSYEVTVAVNTASAAFHMFYFISIAAWSMMFFIHFPIAISEAAQAQEPQTR